MLARLSFPIHDASGGDASSTVWALCGQVDEVTFHKGFFALRCRRSSRVPLLRDPEHGRAKAL